MIVLPVSIEFYFNIWWEYVQSSQYHRHGTDPYPFANLCLVTCPPFFLQRNPFGRPREVTTITNHGKSINHGSVFIPEMDLLVVAILGFHV